MGPVEQRLRQGLANLIVNGWYQGDFTDDTNGPKCALGALRVQEETDSYYYPSSVTKEAERYLNMSLPSRWLRSHLPNRVDIFNDSPRRSFAGILKLYNKAIEAARKDNA